MSHFERERARAMSAVAENLGRLVSNMNVLNRNLESVSQLGSQFDSVSRLWSAFGNAMGHTPDLQSTPPAEPAEHYSQDYDDDDVSVRLPPGVAPGGGISTFQ